MLLPEHYCMQLKQIKSSSLLMCCCVGNFCIPIDTKNSVVATNYIFFYLINILLKFYDSISSVKMSFLYDFPDNVLKKTKNKTVDLMKNETLT